MSSFCIILLSALACIGVVLIIRGLCRFLSARRASYICLCFDKALLEGGKPDLVIICRSDAEEDEIIRRISDGDPRRVYIKRW